MNEEKYLEIIKAFKETIFVLQEILAKKTDTINVLEYKCMEIEAKYDNLIAFLQIKVNKI